MRNSTASESKETKVQPTAGPLEAQLYEMARKMGVKYTRPGVGLRLFGHQKPATKMEAEATLPPSRMSFKRPLGGRRKYIKLWPQEEAGTEAEAKEAGGDEAGPSPTKDNHGGTYPKEITLRVPHMTRDSRKGNWVYDSWRATFGHPFMDTRFAKGHGAGEPVRFRVDDQGMHKYDPTVVADISTVCMGRSTIYNYPNVVWWLQRLVHNVSFHRRPIWMDLRFELAQRARSEECHTMQFEDFQAYQECALKRNQRMEYMIPQYPLHQIGYRKFYSREEPGAKNDDAIEIH